jgi:hypothetical protein
MRRISLTASAFAAALISLPIQAPGQESAPDRRVHVLQISVKPDMLDEWTDLVRSEVLPALKKAGIPSVTATQTALGNANEFFFISPLEKMSMLDMPPALERGLGKEAGQRLTAKLRRCTFFMRSYLVTLVGGLSNAPPPDKMPPFGVYSRYRVLPGKNAEYESYIKNEVLPHYKKAGVYTSFGRRGLGAPSAGEIVIVTYADNFAALEGGPPLRRILGEDVYNKQIAKAAAFRTLVDQTVRSRRRDLSY